MIVERPADCGDLYRQKRRELLAVAGSLTNDGLQTVVPATPAWSVRDVLAHLVGIAADLNALRLGDGDPDAWTDNQVLMRRHGTIADLELEWEQEGGRFEEGLRLLGYEVGSHFVGDLLQHSQDIRAAVGIERISDDEALAVALDFYLDRFHQALATAAVGSVVVRVGDEAWTVGSGAEVAAMTATRFELFRCLGGRRSEAQIRALDWTGAAGAVVPLLSAYPTPIGDLRDG